LASTTDFALKNAIFALLLEEISCQPGLKDELGANEFGEVCSKFFDQALVTVIASIVESNAGIPNLISKCVGHTASYWLLPPPTTVFRNVADILSIGSGSNYEALCRSALLHLY
jgi:hypothetical protein